MLVVTALIWGTAFVAQSVGVKSIGPFTFNTVRMLIGGIVLIPVIIFMNRKKAKTTVKQKKTLILGGVLCGVALFGASSFQQIGIADTTAGKAGFITSLYIIIVPIFGIFLKKRVSKVVWMCVAIACVGMYLLCVKEGFSIGKGDVFILICAVIFSAHILLIDYFSPKTDGVFLSCIQFFTCGILSCIPMFALETPKFTAIFSAWEAVLYAGVLSCGIAYTLQVVAQKNTDPMIASLLLSLESIFAVLAGWMLLDEKMSFREGIGCFMVFAAIILVQMPTRKTVKQNSI